MRRSIHGYALVNMAILAILLLIAFWLVTRVALSAVSSVQAQSVIREARYTYVADP